MVGYSLNASKAVSLEALSVKRR